MINSTSRPDSGFSIVQVLVAFALVAVLAVAVGSMMTGMLQASRNVSAHNDLEILKSTLQLIIGKSEVCAAAFKNSSGSTRASYNATTNSFSDLAIIRMKDNATLISVGGTYGALKIESITMAPNPAVAPKIILAGSPLIPNQTAFMVDLTIVASKMGTTMGGSGNLVIGPLQFDLTVNNDNNNRVFSCGSDSGGSGTSSPFGSLVAVQSMGLNSTTSIPLSDFKLLTITGQAKDGDHTVYSGSIKNDGTSVRATIVGRTTSGDDAVLDVDLTNTPKCMRGYCVSIDSSGNLVFKTNDGGGTISGAAYQRYK